MPTPKTRPRPLQWVYEYRRSPEQDDSDYERSLKALHVLMEGTCDLATIRSDVGKGTLTIEVPVNTAVSAKTVACVAQPLWEGGTVIYFPPSIRPVESRVKTPDPSRGTLIVQNPTHASRVRNVTHIHTGTSAPILSTTAANGYGEVGGQLIGGTRLDFRDIPGVTVWSNVAFVQGHCSKGDYVNWRSDPPTSITPTSEPSSQNKRRSDTTAVEARTAKQSRKTRQDPPPGSSSKALAIPEMFRGSLGQPVAPYQRVVQEKVPEPICANVSNQNTASQPQPQQAYVRADWDTRFRSSNMAPTHQTASHQHPSYRHSMPLHSMLNPYQSEEE
jgi:hypothetical protein